jgi:hypothetical protein
VGCFGPLEGLPQCPVSSCPLNCSAYDEAACNSHSPCRADYCPGCGKMSFTRCAYPSDPPPVCPAIACVVACDMLTTQTACEARHDCHPDFADPGTCDCIAAGCCMTFSRCAAGATARCSGMPLCKSLAPLCAGDYTLAYTDTCYEGCVRKTDCAP